MSYRRRVEDALKVRCVHLKTKAAFLGLPDEDDVENDLDTAIWWCEETCEGLGPDGSSAEPSACDPRRRDGTAPPPRWRGCLARSWRGA